MIKTEYQKKQSRKFWGVFWGVILFLLLITGYGIYKKQSNYQQKIEIENQNALTIYLVGKISPLFDEITATQKKEILKSLDSEINATIDGLFEGVYKNIDAYLDFHYSLIGEYTELTMAITDDLGEAVQDRLFGKDFETNLSLAQNNISQKLRAELDELPNKIEKELKERGELTTQKEREVFSELSKIFELQVNSSVNKVVTSAIVGSSVGGGALAAVVTSKLIAKNVAKKAAAKGGAKLAAKMAASGSAATTGLACGPFALACAAAAATLTWIGTDIVLIEADERLNRENRYNDIKASIDETKELLKAELKNRYKTVLDVVSSEMEDGMQRKVKDMIHR